MATTGIGTVGVSSITDVVVSGAATFNNDINVLGDLNVTGDLSYDEVTGRNLNITGVATVAGIASLGQVDVASGDINISYLNVTGVTTVASENVTDLNVTGVATVANLVGFSSEFSGAIGFTSAATMIGAAITTLNVVGGSVTFHASADGGTGCLL